MPKEEIKSEGNMDLIYICCMYVIQLESEIVKVVE